MNQVEKVIQRKTSSFPLINDEIIRHFPEDKNYNEYLDKVLADFHFVKEAFPLINVCVLPTIHVREVYIYGWLVPAYVYELIGDNVEKDELYITAYYPSNFPEKNIEVEDIHRTINWDLIPKEHRHRLYIDGRNTGLCTHHPEGEINNAPINHRSVKILMSAWKLFYQCKQYVKTGIWKLEDLPHGLDAWTILEKEGYLKRWRDMDRGGQT